MAKRFRADPAASRAPAEVARAIDDLLAGTPAELVHIGARDFAEAFAHAPNGPLAAAVNAIGDPQVYLDAVRRDGELAIPTGRYLNEVAMGGGGDVPRQNRPGGNRPVPDSKGGDGPDSRQAGGSGGSGNGGIPPEGNAGVPEDDDKEKIKEKVTADSPEIKALAERFKRELSTPESEINYKNIPEAMNGKILDVDLARRLCPEYVENAKLWTGATSSPAAAFIEKMFMKKLKENPAGQVVFFAGGGGSGKSTVVHKLFPDTIEKCEIVFDGTLSNSATSLGRIRAVVESGRTALVVYIHRPFHEAVTSVAKRYSETGRWIPAEVLVKQHLGAQDALMCLVDYFEDNPSVSFRVVNNAGFRPSEMSIGHFMTERYIQNDANRESVANEMRAFAIKELPYE
jgi:hypothetical protein